MDELAGSGTEPGSRLERWGRWPWLFVVAAVAMAVRVHLIGQPLDRDEGLYAYMAQRMLLGEVPYRDTFSDKPPVGFVIYAGFLSGFGQTVAGIHMGGALWAALGAMLLCELGRRLHGPVTGFLAGLAFAVSSAEGTLQGSSTNLELLLTPFAIGSLILLNRPVPSLSRCAGAGVLIGLILLTKQQALGHAATAFLWLLVTGWEGKRDLGRYLLRQAVLVSAAMAVVALSFLLFWLPGSLGHYWDGLLLYNLQTYVPREPGTRAWTNLWTSFAPILAGNPLLIALGIAEVFYTVRRPTTSGLLVLAWWLLNLGSVCIGLRFYKHYFLLAQPALALLAATWLGRIAEWGWRSRYTALARTFIVAGCGAGIACPLVIQFDYFFRWNAWQHVHALYGAELFSENGRLASEIAHWTNPSDEVFILGSEPQLYFQAGRRCAGRYAFVHPLTARGPGAARKQRETIDYLRARRPSAILLVAVNMSTLIDPEVDRFLARELVSLTRADYEPVLGMHLRENQAEYESVRDGQAVRPNPGDPAAAFLVVRRKS